MIEKPIFPMKYVSISQRGFTNGSHKNLEAIDINGIDTGIDHGRAPCYIKVLAVLPKKTTGFNNTVLYGTCNEYGTKTSVLCADGRKRILTFAMTHDNDISDLKVGKIFKQNEICYQEGTTGYATGNHIHLEIGEGWQYKKYKDAYGNWALKNLVCAENIFWLLEGHNEIANKGLNGYNFPWTSIGNSAQEDTIPVSEEEETMRMKCVKASLSPNRYPTRASYNGAYNKTSYFINVGDTIVISDMKADTKGNVVCKIADCITNGKSSSVLNNRWFAYDKEYFK